jgi:3-hydroxybutyryl-CoA dehydrogenase
MINKVGIVGAGTMGADIAHLSAQSGFEVLIYDTDDRKSGQAFASIQKKLNSDVDKGRLEIDKVAEISSSITVYKNFEALSAADLVIECVYEDEKLKKDVFTQLDEVCRPETILASNTSSISITTIASATKRPESVIGMHFLIPARVNKLVEIIPGFLTTRETVETVKSMLKKMGKTFVESKDYPGFLLNRMVCPMINEAVFLLYEGAGTAETIDRVMKTGLNLPMGPLALADMIGLDIVLAVAEEMYRGFSDPKYRPCPLLKQHVSAGFLGRKSGRGFYRY